MTTTGFKARVALLTEELSNCIRLCIDIRENRKNGRNNRNLSQLTTALESAQYAIPVEYSATRKILGARMDAGDDSARSEMDGYIWELQNRIKPKLRDIARPHGDKGECLKELLSIWNRTYLDYSNTIGSLSRRIQEKAANKPTPDEKPRKPKETEGFSISMEEFVRMLEHMKNSWEETYVAGKVLYVNAFDKNKSQWEVPDGFIKAYPRRARVPSWDRRPNNGW